MSMLKYLEENKKIRNIELLTLVVLLIISLSSYIYGFVKINAVPEKLEYVGTITLNRDFDNEDYDEDSTVCDVVYVNEDKSLLISYPYEEYIQLDNETIEAHEYLCEDGSSLIFKDKEINEDIIKDAYRYSKSTEMMNIFNIGNALIILALSLSVILFYSKFFTTYEKVWFISIMFLATIVAILFPEESANGVNGIIIMLLYLLDTFLNILCELLISKQSRYNFLVSVLVEICEIVICLVLMYRFATMAVTLFFWLPIDIISFINWSKHKDDDEDELTVVRRLKGYQELLVVLAIIIWTVVVGYFISGLDIATDFLNNRNLELIIIYIDACASAVGIANGLFIFFRLREQWLAWYISAFLETIINILSGQYVLLILKLGYFTNTTYGYLKWSNYIKTHKEDNKSLF